MLARFAVLAVLAASSAVAQPLRASSGEMRFPDPIAQAPQRAAALPPGFYLETAASGFAQPVAAAFAPDGRMFVLEKEGRVHVVENGQSRVLLDLTFEVLNQHDRGMLGVAVDPGFAQNGFLYLSYVVSIDGQDRPRSDAFGRVTRYRVDAQGAADASSRRVLIGQEFASGIPTCYDSHSIGTLEFGSDGTLLVGTGDGASYTTEDVGGLYNNCFGDDRISQSEDVGAFRSQQVESLAGKILRVSPVDGRGLASNPFWTGNADDNASKVYALGFRNPFRFDVDRALGSADPADGNPGPIYLGDVGWSTWEEISVVRRGENHGWPCREGAHDQPNNYRQTALGQQICPGLATSNPTFEWNHRDATLSTPPTRQGASVVGGAVYRGTRYPAAYRGRFMYGDYARGWIATASISATGALAGDALFSADAGFVVDVAYDPFTQNLFYVDVAMGTVSRLRHTDGDANTSPVVAAQATPTNGLAPLTVQFSSTGTADPDGDALTYAWTFGNGETATGPAPSTIYTTPGNYTARLTVTDARGASAAADVPISVRSTGSPPAVTIPQPALGTRALSGQTITLAAAATDPDAGQTAGLRYAWAVTLVHNEHQHPNAFAATTASASYTVPFHGDLGESYALLIRLTVTDDTGLATVVERTVGIGEDGGQQDITDRATAIAFATPVGSQGSGTLATIHDGVTPEPFVGAATPALAALQFDTYANDPTRASEWIGYTFGRTERLGRLRLHDGLHFNDGGWFETLSVEVRQDGAWEPVTGLAIAPAYLGPNGRQFEVYDLTFAPTEGDGIRIVGRPGGSSRFISVSELRVFTAGGTPLGPLPTEWTGADIGPVYGAGSSGYGNDTFTVRGGGDLWGDLDHFHYVYRVLAGDGTVTARLTSLAGASPWAKAGVMIRAGTAGDAPYAMMLGTAAQGFHLQSRRTQGATTDWQGGPDIRVPSWVRLQRIGRNVTAFVSADGQTWTLVGSVQTELGTNALVGLAATSTDYSGRDDVATATFTDVSVGRPSGTGPEADVTERGIPIASFVPAGAGPEALAVLRDGVAPEPTTVFPSSFDNQYDTYDGDGQLVGYFGYVFGDTPQTVSRLRFTEGVHQGIGGWFETLGVSVTTDGTMWTDLSGVAVSPTYPGANDGRHFDTYDLTFAPTDVRGVRVSGRAGGSARFVSASELRVFAPAATVGLPDGWTSGDIGPVRALGSTRYSDGTFTLRGNGDLWGDRDHFQFASTSLTGNGSVTARVVSVEGANPWAKSGVMIRAGRGAQAPYAMMTVTPGRGVHLQTRATEAAEAEWFGGDGDGTAPVWVRVERDGDLFTGYLSADGVTWNTVATAQVAMPDEVAIGLATTSTDATGNGTLSTAVFSDVAIGGPAVLGRAAAASAQTAPDFAIESVFPNPARSSATVRVGISVPGTYRVELLDVLGRRVFEEVLREDAAIVRNVGIDLSGQSAGLYVLRVFQEGGETVTGRVTVVR